MKYIFVVAILLFPVFCSANIGVILEGTGWIKANEWIPLTGFDVQGDGIPELVYSTSDGTAVRAINKSGSELWAYTLDPGEVCPSCSIDPQFWHISFSGFFETEPGQRDGVLEVDYSNLLGESWHGVLLVSAASNADLRQVIENRWFEEARDLDGDGIMEIMVRYDNWPDPTEYWEILSYDWNQSGVPNSTPSAKIDLMQNMPNPFNPTTKVQFRMHNSGDVKLEIYSVGGRLVYQADLGNLVEGTHSYDWNGRDRSGRSLPSGNYFYSIISEGSRQSRKMLLLK